MNASLARKTGTPSRTRTGPPPIASLTVSHPGWRISRTVTEVPAGASAESFWAAVPRATSTAVPGAIGTDAFWMTPETPAKWSTFGVAASNGERITETAPGMRGVDGPQSGVKIEMPFASGASLNALRALRWLSPRQVPKRRTRRTSSVPSSVIPALERFPLGELTSTPSFKKMPLGPPFFEA